jgi:hypothetical protein
MIFAVLSVVLDASRIKNAAPASIVSCAPGTNGIPVANSPEVPSGGATVAAAGCSSRGGSEAVDGPTPETDIDYPNGVNDHAKLTETKRSCCAKYYSIYKRRRPPALPWECAPARCSARVFSSPASIASSVATMSVTV